MTSKINHLSQNWLSISSIFSIGANYYHNQLKGESGKIGNSISAFGLGVGYDLLAEYKFADRYSIGLKAS